MIAESQDDKSMITVDKSRQDEILAAAEQAIVEAAKVRHDLLSQLTRLALVDLTIGIAVKRRDHA